MNGKRFFFLSFFLSALFFSQVAFSQSIVLATPGPNTDVYEATNLVPLVDNNIDPLMERTAALRYYLMQEVVSSDPGILNITRTAGGNGVTGVFSIVTITGLTPAMVESQITASIAASNTFLVNYKNQNGLTWTQLSNYIKSVLLNN